jgi:tetratricopeptide (TPR) repeat protein
MVRRTAEVVLGLRIEMRSMGVVGILVVWVGLSFFGMARQQGGLPEARADFERGDYAGAIRTIEEAPTGERLPAEAYHLLVESRARLSQVPEALEACEQGLQFYPSDAKLDELYVSLAATLPPDDARRRLERRVSQYPASVEASKALGYILFRENPRHPRVEKLLTRAAQAAPTDAEARFLYGQWACLNNRHALCAAELRQALALDAATDYARMQIHTLIGVAENKQGNIEEAEAAFEAARVHNRRLDQPSLHAAYQHLKFLVELSRFGPSEELAEEMLRWAPRFGPARYERARLLARQGRLEEAVAEAALALQTLQQDDPTLMKAAHAFMAKTCFALGRTEEALLHQKWIEENQ